MNQAAASGASEASGGSAGASSSSAQLESGGGICFSCPNEVAKRIAQLYGDEQLADVVFVVCQGQDGPERRFVGHRNIMSTWSRPLDRMLCGSFAESSSREVFIRDVEPSAFEAMLKLMYCGTTEITVDNVLAILDVSVRFDVAPLMQFAVQFLQNHTSSEHACRMLEVGVQYGLVKLMDKCIELIVTDDHILESEDFNRLSQAAVIELAKHNSWNMHEDEIYDTMLRWGAANSSSVEDYRALVEPILEHLRYPHMSVEKLKGMTTTNEVPNQLIFDALFFKLHHSGPDDQSLTGRYRPRTGSLLFSWVPTSKVTVSGNSRENARHTSSNGFTGVRGDRRMQHGVYSWTIDIAETQSSWIFVGVAQADDPNDVAWRSTGRMLYCLDSRFFHQGSGQNHPCGDRKICSGDCIRVVLDCTRHTLSFGINSEKPLTLFRDLAPVAYVPAVDLRDCGDKVHILSSNPHVRSNDQTWSGSPTRSQHPPESPQANGGVSRLPIPNDGEADAAAPAASAHQQQRGRPSALALDVLTGAPPQAMDTQSLGRGDVTSSLGGAYGSGAVGGNGLAAISGPVGSTVSATATVTTAAAASGDPPARRATLQGSEAHYGLPPHPSFSAHQAHQSHYANVPHGYGFSPATVPHGHNAGSCGLGLVAPGIVHAAHIHGPMGISPGHGPGSSGGGVGGGGTSSSSARMSQPRQSGCPQGAVPPAAVNAAAVSAPAPAPVPAVAAAMGPTQAHDRGCASPPNATVSTIAASGSSPRSPAAGGGSAGADGLARLAPVLDDSCAPGPSSSTAACTLDDSGGANGAVA